MDCAAHSLPCLGCVLAARKSQWAELVQKLFGIARDVGVSGCLATRQALARLWESVLRQASGRTLPHMVRISADRSKQADQKIPWPGMRSREAPCERLACESSLISLRVKLSKAFSDISDNVLSQYVTFIPLWRERSRSPVPVFPSRLT